MIAANEQASADLTQEAVFFLAKSLNQTAQKFKTICYGIRLHAIVS
jgi:hypothetical protein